MKRITSSLLALLLALSMLIGMVPAAYAAPADTIESIDPTETVDSSETEDVSDEAEEVAAQATEGTAVAEVNGNTYPDLKTAISAMSTGATLKLLDDVNLGTSAIGFYKSGTENLTFDLNGHTITSSYDEKGTVTATRNGLLIMNGTIVNNSTSSTKTTSAVYVSNGGTTTLRNVKLISNMSGLAVCDLDGNSKSKSATVTIEDDTTVGDNVQYGVYLSSLKATAQKERAVTLNINGGTITGTKNGVYVYGPGSSKYGTVKASITGGTVSDVMVSTGDGPKTPVDIAISGGTITGALTSLGTNEVAISGGTIIGDLKQNGENATISITGGTIGGALNNTNGTITVTGGTFTTADPSDYLADGYEFVNGQVTSSSSTTGVAKVGETPYATLDAAFSALDSTNYTLTLLDESAWDTATPVYWEAGTQRNYAATLTDALTAAYKENAGDIKIVCRPGADVGTMTHGHVADDITIYGNNAYISGGECELEVDTYKFSRETGAQDTTNGESLTKDITITAYELDNLGVWGQRTTDKTVTVNLTDCDGKAIDGKENVQRVYISGTSGVNNITLTGCDFMTNNTSVYSNADGAISIKGCSFTGSKVPVNFNHKANGEQRLTVSNSTFKNCGDNGEWNQFAAPVRFVNSGSGTQTASVNSCTFTETVGSNGDILIGDGRTGEKSNDVSLTVTNTTATVKAQKPGYYNNGTVADATKGKEKPVTSGETLNTSVEEMLPTALTAYVTVNGGTEQYATLDEAITAAEPENGVITYTVTGVVSTDAAGWIQVAKAGLTNLTEVKFVGVGTGAGITINGDLAILADRNYDIDVSFENLTLRKPNPKYGGDYGHSTNYFTCWLRNTDAANNTVTYTNCTFPNGACNNQYGKTVYANCKFTNATSGKYNLWNYGGNTEIKNSTFTGTRGIKTYNEGTLAVAPTVKIENTTFDSLTEKAAVVASKATDITFDNVTTKDCAKGTFQKDIENSGEEMTITANGSGISGSFNITAEKGEEAAKNEFNISAGTFNSEVSSDYCADGFEVKANENGTYGVVGSTQTTKGTRENPYTLDDLSTMTRAEYIAAQERLGGTMYVTVGDYSYETNGTLGNGTADNSDRDSTKMNYYGAPGAKEGQYSDAAVGKNIVFVGGNITSGVTGYKDVDNPGTSLLLAVPAYTNVTFEGTTFKNVMSFNYQLYTSPWSQLGELKFDGCTFNGIIVGAIAAQTLTFNNCNFGNYTNTYAENGKNVGANNSNPIWVRPAYGNWTKGDNEGQGSDFKSLTTINFTGNTVVSTRPVKFERIAQWEMDTTVTATGNKFDIKDTGEKKNVGLYFGANAKFDLVVEGNTKNGSTAALYTAVYSAPNGGQYAGLPAGSTVKDSNGQDAVLEDAYEWKSTKKLTLKTTEEVAELSTTDSKNNHVTVRFATLAAAVKAAKPSDTITLLDNIKLTAAQTISKKLTIDLNGKTLDSTVYQTIKLNAGADLTVMDSGTNGKITNSYAPGSAYPSTIYLNEPKTAFTLVSGTIESDPNETSLQSVAINSKKVACTVNIQGGSVVVPAGATEGRSIVAGKDMTLNISGGTITGGLHGVDAYGGSTVNITGGKVTATYVDTGVIKEAYGMRIIGTANVTINGGEIQGIKMDDDGYKLDVPNVTLVSGKITGSFYSITKGTIVFTVDPTATIIFANDTVSKFLPSTVELVQNTDGTYGVKKGSYVAEVNGKQYTSLQAAFDAAVTGNTVTLLDDLTETDAEDAHIVYNLTGKTLDLNGKTYTHNNFAHVFEGTGGTIKNGKMVCVNGSYALFIGDEGETTNFTVDGVELTGGINIYNATGVVLKNLTVNGTNYYAVWLDEGAAATIESGTYNAGDVAAFNAAKGSALAITGGTVNTNGKTLMGTSGGTLSVSGGTFDRAVLPKYCADGFIPTQNEDGTYGVKEGSYVAEVNGTKYETLQAAIDAAGSGKTVTLLCNTRENVTINKDITLDLGGKTLTNAGEHTIVNNGTLTIMDSVGTGKVDNVTHGRGALVNNGTVILTGGTFERSEEKGTLEPYVTGGNSWYTIANYGTMTIDNGTTVKNAGGYSSNIRNGGQDSTAKLTINGGTFDGGVNTVKNDANGVLEIKGGELKNTAQYVIMNWNQATISGGTFETAETAGAVLFSSAYGTDGTACGELTITGGTFKAAGSKLIDDAYDADNHGTVKISGGSFNRAVDPKHCDTGFIPTQNADGTYGVKEGTYVAETGGVYYESLQAAIDAARRNGTVKLLADTRENVTISTPYLTLDLNGHTLNGGTEKGKPALTVTARVTVKDGSEAQTGTIMREDTAENSGVSSHYVIDIQGGGWLTFESGNVKNGSGVVGVKGASLVRVGDDSVAKYPGLNIKGGTFTQDNFIVIRVDRGDLFLNGGTLNSANSYAIKDWHRATIKGGTVNGAVAAWTYSGGLNSDLTISGGTINGDVTSVNYGNAEGRTAKVSITGGTINGKLDTRSYDPATNELTSIDDAAKATIEVTGGTFNNDPTKYVVENSKVTNNADGTFGVEKAYLAKVGETSYYTMDEAFKAQTASGEPIVLLRDYTTGSTFNSGSIKRTVDLGDHTWTYTGTDVNSAAFEINYPDATLTVKNGKVVSNTMLGLIPTAKGKDGTITYDNAGLVFERIEATANGHSGIETNGSNTNDSVTLKDSTLNVPNGFGIYFPSSGTLTIENSKINAKTMGVQVCAGSLKISGEGTAITVTGDAVPKTENDGAIQDGAAISIVNRTGYKGLDTITVTGGTFTAKTGNAAIKAYNWANNNETDFTEPTKVEVSGGTFSAEVPADLCAPGYVPQDNGDGTYGVAKAPAVAKIGETEFTSLKDAIAKAEEGATIDIVNDINTPNVSYEITKNLTIKLNGHTITADGYDAVFQIGKIADVVLEGPGSVVAVENTGSAGKYAMAVWACSAGCTVTINGKINFSQNITHTDDPQMDMIYASQGTIIINDGRYESGTPAWTLNCKDAAYKDGTAKIIVNGGTFVGYDPRNNTAEGKGTSFVAAGVGVDKNTDGTFTAKPNMVAQIVDADGNSVAAYATLKEAVNAAKSGETVIVLKEATVEERITAEANITIDLNQKTVTVADGAGTMLKTTGDVTIKNGTLTSAVTANIINAYGKLKLESVKIYGSTVDGSNLVNVLGNAEVTIDAASEIVADGVGVAVFVGEESAAKDAKYTLNIYGKVTQKGKSYAISGNGSYPGTSYINIYEGAEVKANNIAEKKDCCAIYQPQAGEINVYGGLVEGYCAIVMKSGTLNISGGTVRGIRNDNVLGDNNSAGNGASYDGSAIVVDSRKTGYAGNVKINVTGGTVESYYSTAIREIGNDSSMTQLVELTVTGGEILGASKNLTNAENDILVRDISVSNVAISGGTFNHEVQADYCAVGYEPSEKDASGMYTVQKVSGNAYYVDNNGKPVYGDLEKLLADSATNSKAIMLLDDVVTYGTDFLYLRANKTIDLNGKTLVLPGKLFGFGKIIDSTDGTGLLKIGDMDGSQLPSNNGYLPVLDKAVEGYRLYSYTMKLFKTGYNVVGNGNTVKFAVQIEFANLDAWNKIAADDNSVELVFEAKWNTNVSIFRFEDTQLDKIAKDVTEEKRIGYFILTINGFNNISGVEFRMTPQIKCKLFTQTIDTIIYK